MILASGVALVVLLHNLDSPWIKRRVKAIVRTSVGLDVDYASLRVGLFTGAQIDGLSVQSPVELRALAPELLRVDQAVARWSLRSIFGHGPALERLSVTGVTATIVVDEAGKTSFDAIPGKNPPPPPRAAAPLSRSTSFLTTAPPVDTVDVAGVTLVLVESVRGSVSRRTQLQGISLSMLVRPAPEGRGFRVDADLGSRAAPLELQLTRKGDDASAGARAKLWLAADASPAAIHTALDLRLTEQTLAPGLPGETGLHAQAGVAFDPESSSTEITLVGADLGDGTATADASLAVPDHGDPVVHHARGDVDVARVLALLPPGLAPLAMTAERARARCEIDALVVGPVLHLADGGKASVELDLSNAVVRLPSGPLQLREGSLALHARPEAAGGVAGEGTVRLSGAVLDLSGDPVTVDGLLVDLEAKQDPEGAIAGRVGVRFPRVTLGSRSPVTAREAHAELSVHDLHVDADHPLSTRGDISLETEIGSFESRSKGGYSLAEGLVMRAHTALDGHAPFSADVDARASRLHVTGRGGASLADGPAHVEARARDVRPDPARPSASQGVVHLEADVGEAQATLDATKVADAADFDLRSSASSLKSVRPWLPAELARAPWERMALDVRSRGRAEHLVSGDPFVRQTTEVALQNPALMDLAAKEITLTLKSAGTAHEHRADLDLHAKALAVAGGSPSDDHLTLAAHVDREHPSLDLELATEGRASTKLSASLRFDPNRRAVQYGVDGDFGGLAPLSPLLAQVHGLEGFDVSQLELGFTGRGALLGVVAGVDRDGTIALEPSPSRTAAVEGSAEVRARRFRWARGDTAIVAPQLTWHGDLRVVEERRVLDARLEVGGLHLDIGSHDVDLDGVRDEAHVAVSGDLTDPTLELSQRLSVTTVVQDLVPEYPVGDLGLTLTAEQGSEHVVHVSDLRVTNGAGGTTLGLQGNVDLGEGRRTLSLTTSLTQDLARLSTVPERFKGTGKLAVDATVTSPDFSHYQVRASVKAKDVTATLRRANVDVDKANGEVPITVALLVTETGVGLERSERRSPYSMLRFADQHPLLSRSGYISLSRLQTPFVTIAPLAGNLEIDQNVVSLRQFEMGIRGGRVTGQMGLDWDGPRSTVELHVRATGVQSSHGEPFDGNIAVALSAADRTVEGRAEILRIGPRHLLDLLDLQDPLHVDPAINRIRTALAFGYPDSLHLVFDHGFANAHLQLGGLARLVSIGDLTGLPMGPIVDRMLAPVLEGPSAKEMP